MIRASTALTIVLTVGAARAQPPPPPLGGPPPPPPASGPLPPGMEAPEPATKFFRVEGSAFVGLKNVDFGARLTVAYAINRVFRVHTGGRLYIGADDLSFDVHGGFDLRLRTQGPLSFEFSPEAVLVDASHIGGGARLSTIYAIRPESLEVSAGTEVVGGDFKHDFLLFSEIAVAALF